MPGPPEAAARPTPATTPGSEMPTAVAVMARAGGENFPVASRVLPRPIRAHLLAIYGFARLTDELGDDTAGDRLAHLDWLEAEVERARRGEATHPLLARLAPTLALPDLPHGCFRDLIEANRRDQVVHRYATFGDLLDYCRLSANPVGRLVLAVLGATTPQREAWSDQVCSALQVIEHLQDVAEDLERGRVYLPAEDLERFGCSEADLASSTAGPALRGVVALQAARSRALLDAGVPLTASLSGRARLAVAGFVAGGRAALDAIERADFDVVGVACRPAPAAMARNLLQVLAARKAPAPGVATAGAAPQHGGGHQ
ncbi:MAG TPA: squalene synthase HpnC [Acidimicrobiales bacterium]|nr:squalene synthase HpnC [Acidimicrobiales bacterium]